jgi:hypothetical protein
LNETGRYGGGVFCRNSSPEFIDCAIGGNSAESEGGGIYSFDSTPIFTDCIIGGNSAGMKGGGIWSKVSFLMLDNCIVRGNSANYGAGSYFEDSESELTRCTITRNSARKGGGVYILNSSLLFKKCTIMKNSSDYSNRSRDVAPRHGGGGIACSSSSLELTNCLITGNSAEYGGAISFSNSAPLFTNCTITENFANESGGGLFCWDESFVITNCILWNNPGLSIYCVRTEGNPEITFSCLDTPWPGEGNITTDPKFVQRGMLYDNGTPDYTHDDNWQPGDYHLQGNSPCIDSGDAAAAPFTDIEGDNRLCGGGVVDIGAYEWGSCMAFIRGEINNDGVRNIVDVVSLLSYRFAGGDEPACLDAADCNDDGRINIADAILLLGHLFSGAGPLPDPFEICGIDITLDSLDCKSCKQCAEE